VAEQGRETIPQFGVLRSCLPTAFDIKTISIMITGVGGMMTFFLSFRVVFFSGIR
jgi:hypothetical protein